MCTEDFCTSCCLVVVAVPTLPFVGGGCHRPHCCWWLPLPRVMVVVVAVIAFYWWWWLPLPPLIVSLVALLCFKREKHITTTSETSKKGNIESKT